MFKWYFKNLLRKEYRLGVHLLAGVLLMLPLITALLVVSKNLCFPWNIICLLSSAVWWEG